MGLFFFIYLFFKIVCLVPHVCRLLTLPCRLASALCLATREMAYAALTILLQSLDKYSHPNRHFFLVKNHHLQSLVENLEFLQKFLESSTIDCNHQELMKCFEARVRDLSFKAQDVIEEFVSGNECRLEDPIDMFYSQYGVHFTLQQILGEIELLKKEAIEIREKISRDESAVKDEILETVPGKESSVKDLAADMKIEDTIVENVDEGLRVIVDRLISSSPNLEIFCFFCEYECSHGDYKSFLGATARRKLDYLAGLVHGHPLIANHFDLRLLIEWSHIFYCGLTLRYYKRGELTCSKIERLPVKREKILKRKLKYKRYLVVLRESRALELDHFQRWFPEDYQGSRVIFLGTEKAFTTGLVPSQSGNGISKTILFPKL